MTDVLDRFSRATREWFSGAFPEATPAQLGAWNAVSSGNNALVIAPTGSGKTLSAFLWSIDQIMSTPQPERPGVRVLYISPLKALGVDVERNLRAPLVGITQTAKRLGVDPPVITVGVRSGDTPAAERRSMVKHPPDILITTPESLFLLLTSASREILRTIDTIIIDEVHAVAATKRGAHLAVSLERLDEILDTPAQRIGLSATVKPRDEIARFLGGTRPVQIVAPPANKTFDLNVIVPVDDMTALPAAAQPKEGSTAGALGGEAQGSIWPHVEEKIVDDVLAHKSSIVFVNSRRLAEKLTARLNEIYAERLGLGVGGAVRDAAIDPALRLRPPAESIGQSGQTAASEPDAPVLARAHHGSVSKEQRAIVENELKTGVLRCVVATSSLELGIDMGAVDLVVQVESPSSVSSGLQRIGRAGHQVGEISKGHVYPKHRSDLLHSAVVAARMSAGELEAIAIPSNPLDILAQQTVAACALEEIDIDDWFSTVRKSAPFTALPRSVFDATLDLLAGRYPSDEFAELRPRIIWDRDAGTITGKPGAQRLAVTSGGTIPDRGLFGVFMVGAETGRTGSARVGELDEEMVYESRVGDVFALGATSWRIHEITHDRVMVTPAFGEPGRLPFWRGDGIGRPAELGKAIGAFTRTLASLSPAKAKEAALGAGLDERAANNLVAFIAEQRDATNHVPSDTTLVIERFRDELGDWRLILHSPYGMQVHSPWSLAVAARIREHFDLEGAAVASDDGIVVRLPDTDGETPGAELFLFEADELEAIVTEELGGSALFASRFRENAARALLLPRQNPAKRSPLWQQRQRSAQLLSVARKYPQFPVILETVRECLQDVYDLPALIGITRDIDARRIRVVETETSESSPFAKAMLFGYVAAFVYEGDTPLAERKAAALALDQNLLGELLGRVELRELLDPAVIRAVENELQRLDPDRQARDAEGIAELVRVLGPLDETELLARTQEEGREHLGDWLASLAAAKRILPVTVAGVAQWAAIEDASRLRDAIGVPIPFGVPDAFIEPVADPLGDLISRFARSHAPFLVSEAAARFGLGHAVVAEVLRRLATEKRVVEGEFRPWSSAQNDERPTATSEWCDSEVLRRLRRRSLAALRHEVEPVDAASFARFLTSWHHLDATVRGTDGLLEVIEQLQGSPIPASAWETLILPARVRDYSPAMLDELLANGEVIWQAQGSLPGKDGWLTLHLAESAPLTLATPSITIAEVPPLESAILEVLSGGGGYFFRSLADTLLTHHGQVVSDDAVAEALWALVWAGFIANDTLTPLRVLTGSGKAAHSTKRAPSRARMARSSLRSRSALSDVAMRRALPSRTGPPTVAGRWSVLPAPERDATIRAHATAEVLLDRYGIVTRGSVVSERTPGGFAVTYRVLTSFEESGQARRGYFVEKLGASQFGTAGTIDRLRGFAADSPHEQSRIDRGEHRAFTIAASDPANPYGAALPWPPGKKHRPGRKAGAVVVLVDGALVFYLERGGKTLLSFVDDPAIHQAAANSLAHAVRSGRIDKLTIDKVDGIFVVGTDLGRALERAGFSLTPQGARLRRD